MKGYSIVLSTVMVQETMIIESPNKSHDMIIVVENLRIMVDGHVKKEPTSRHTKH